MGEGVEHVEVVVVKHLPSFGHTTVVYQLVQTVGVVVGVVTTTGGEVVTVTPGRLVVTITVVETPGEHVSFWMTVVVS